MWQIQCYINYPIVFTLSYQEWVWSPTCWSKPEDHSTGKGHHARASHYIMMDSIIPTPNLKPAFTNSHIWLTAGTLPNSDNLLLAWHTPQKKQPNSLAKSGVGNEQPIRSPHTGGIVRSSKEHRWSWRALPKDRYSPAQINVEWIMGDWIAWHKIQDVQATLSRHLHLKKT